MPAVVALVTLRWGDNVIAVRTAHDGVDVAVSGDGRALTALPAGAPGADCAVRIVGDVAVIAVPAGCEARRHGGTDARGPGGATGERLALRPDEGASVRLGEAGDPAAPLELCVEVGHGGRAGLRPPVSLFARGRGHVLVVGVLHAAFMLWSGRVAAVDLDTEATVDLLEMQWALQRAERQRDAGEEPPPFHMPRGPILPRDAPPSSLLQMPWMRQPSRPEEPRQVRMRDLDDRASFVLPGAPPAIE